jgi:hypothetical protein
MSMSGSLRRVCSLRADGPEHFLVAAFGLIGDSTRLPAPPLFFRKKAVLAMCQKCVEIDKKIAHYQNVARSVLDPPSLRSIDNIIAELEARKDALHPERGH